MGDERRGGSRDDRRTPPSGTYWRIGAIDRMIEDVGARVRSLDERLRQLELDMRSGLAERAGDARALRDLIDRLHSEGARRQAALQEIERRLDKVEHDRGHNPKGTLVASGAGAAGGGVLVAIAELIRRLLAG